MTAEIPSSRTTRGAHFLLAAATLLGAWLLFQVQPMIAKRLLPWYGGGTAIWTTRCCSSRRLLAGYCYAHLLVSGFAPGGRRRCTPGCVVGNLGSSDPAGAADGVVAADER